MTEMAGQDTGGIAPDTQGIDNAAPDNSGGDQGTGGINPAWNDLLGVVPSQLHSQVTPHLTKWDQGVQQKIQQVHSQYEPYKRFVDGGIQPDNIEYALSVMQAIEERPHEVLSALQDWIGQNDQSGQQQPQVQNPEQQGQNQPPDGSSNTEGIPDEVFNHPQFQEMRQMLDTMAQYLVEQQSTQEQTQEDQRLEQELNAAREQHGEFDEEWVLTKMLNNPDLELNQAIEQYRQFEQGILQKARTPAPPVLSPGGQAPNQQLDPKSLDDKGRRALVMQMLQNAQQQNQ